MMTDIKGEFEALKQKILGELDAFEAKVNGEEMQEGEEEMNMGKMEGEAESPDDGEVTGKPAPFGKKKAPGLMVAIMGGKGK